MSDRAQQISERLFDFIKEEMRGEAAARQFAGPLGLREADGSPTPPGADLVTAFGMTYALMALDFWQGNPIAAMESFGAAMHSAMQDPKVLDRVRFLRMPARPAG